MKNFLCINQHIDILSIYCVHVKLFLIAGYIQNKLFIKLETKYFNLTLKQRGLLQTF